MNQSPPLNKNSHSASQHKSIFHRWIMGQSIKNKLKLAILSVSSLGIISAAVILLIIQRADIRQNMASDLNALSDIIAENSEPAIIFGDEVEGINILSSLSKKKSIRAAILYDGKDRVFASSTLGYQNESIEHDFLKSDAVSLFSDTYFEIKKPIIVNDNKIGTLYLRSDLSPIENAMNKLLYSILIMFIALEILAYFLASYLQHLISTPIISLAETARQIAREEDYSVRAKVYAKDEVGDLTEDVNYMLSQVEYRETALRESEQRFQTLIEHAADAIYLFDLEGKILHANPSACRSLGYKTHELLNLRVNDIDINLVTLEQPPQSWREIKTDESITVYSQFVRKSGSLFPVEIHFGRFEFEKEVFILAFARDITKRKQAEAALQQSNEDLEFKIEQRTEELTQANKELTRTTERAEAANQAKSEFLANMSHEIRTPLNAVLGFTDLLKDSELAVKQASYVESIQAGASGLLTIINDVLDLSKIEAGKLALEYEPVDTYTFIGDVEKIFSQSIRAKELEFEIVIERELPATLVLDQTRLRQILFNLIGNAIKFTDSGFIRIYLSYQKSRSVNQSGGQRIDLDIALQDSGKGIAPDQLEKIFEEFVQHKGQSNAEFGGTGIGLSICRKLAKIMGGEISAHSEVGIGSVFTLRLRDIEIGKNSTNVLSKISEQAIEFDKASILLVDDIQSNRNLIMEQFQQTSLDFYEAVNGLEALQMASEKKFDLILMDIRMPVMDGIAATRQLKAAPETRDIPIVALTASVSKEKDYKLKQSNFNKILHKPIRKNEIVSVFRDYLHYQQCDNLVESEIPIADDNDDTKSHSRYGFSELDKTELGQFLRWLKKIHASSYRDAVSSGMVSAIDKFADDLLADRNSQLAPAIYEYAKSIKQAVALFNIEEIEILMPEYDEIISELEKELFKGTH